MTSLAPSSGLPGTLVTIHGDSLTGATLVCFGPACTATFDAIDDGTVAARVPFSPLEGATVDVSVTTSDGTSPTSAADIFTLL